MSNVYHPKFPSSRFAMMNIYTPPKNVEMFLIRSTDGWILFRMDLLVVVVMTEFILILPADSSSLVARKEDKVVKKIIRVVCSSLIITAGITNFIAGVTD
jgi:hypothetical protein